MVKIRGKFLEVMNPDKFPDLDAESFLHITLLDEQDIPEAFSGLSHVYPNLMQMEYDNIRTREKRNLQVKREIAKMHPEEMFGMKK